MGTSGFGVEDYRISKADRRGEAVGGAATVGGAAVTGRSLLHASGASGAARKIHREEMFKPAVYGNAKNVARLTSKAQYLKKLSRGQLGVAGAGALATGAGVLGFASSRRARRQSDYELAKAFDSERSRHSRQNLYVGGLSGGAVVAGAGAAKAGYHAVDARKRAKVQRTSAETVSRKLKDKVEAMTTPGHKAPQTKSVKNIVVLGEEHGRAMAHGHGAAKLARKARILTRVGAGSALGAAALGAGAYGVHRYDRHGGGRSYWD